MCSQKIQTKKITNILINELNKIANSINLHTAIYTGGKQIKSPYSKTQYFHRMLNPKKLIEIGFANLKPKWTINMMTKYYNLPLKHLTKGFRVMKNDDVGKVLDLFQCYNSKFNISQSFNIQSILHWFLPRENIIYSYVVEDLHSKNITDFVSFYSINTSILNNPKYSILKTAYLYYYVNTKTNLKDLIKDVLIEAKQLNFDVVNCLDIMDNKSFLNDLKFVEGNGHLLYFLHNMNYEKIESSKIGLILL